MERTSSVGYSLAQRPRFTGWVWLIPIVTILMTTATIWFYIQNTATLLMQSILPDYRLDILQITIGLVYPILGAFITQRKPGLVIGWLLCLMGLFSALYLFSTGYAVYAYYPRRFGMPLAEEMAWLQNWAWFVPIDLSVVMIFLYPNGRALSLRWRVLAWVTLALVPVLVGIMYSLTWEYHGSVLLMPVSTLPSSLLEKQRLLSEFSLPVIGMLVFLMMPLAVSSLILRLRRSIGVERQQIKWFLFAGSIFGTVLFLDLFLDFVFPESDPWVDLILWNGILPILSIGMAVAIAFAIRRHRLFDIDLVIRRTLVYSTLTAALALIYFASILILQAGIHSLFDTTSPIAVVISTLLIAALFTPLRRRFQTIIDRRFYRGRDNADHAMAALSAAIQNEVNLDTLSGALIDTVDQTFRPDHVSLWLKK